MSDTDSNQVGSTIPPELASDRNHWLVTLRGKVSGTEQYRSYHLAAEAEGRARYEVLRRWGGEFDELPFAVHAERYYDWRRWETQTEGRQGMQSEGVTF